MQYIDVEQGSAEWLEARKGVITGTRLKSVMGTPAARKTLIYELIAEVVAPTPEGYKSTAMERGNIIEELVKEEYPDVEEIGLVKKYDWLGISPDGLIPDRTQRFEGDNELRYVKAIEVKAPEPKAFVKYSIERGIPDEYKWQVVHYYVVIDDLWNLDMIIRNPEIYDKDYRTIVIHTTREQFTKEIAEAKEKLSSFRIEWQEALRKFITNP